ncbi:efflux RND transporter periplasmic adaptor subunit [Bacillus songklensis]|uniref:Efflux RND transporter periplasmic adaptor subunit n=1 Tax=Bacillus songklensis TaxID=1069116 RepID=A0ABV8B289_9BACI
MKKPLTPLALLLLITACGPKEITTEDLENKEIPVKTEKVQREDLSNTVKLSGIAIPAKQIPLFSPAPLTVKKIHKKAGDTVEKGDLLLSLDESTGVQQLKSAKKAASFINEAVAKAESAPQALNSKKDSLYKNQQELDKALKEAEQQLNQVQAGELAPSDVLKDSLDIVLKQARLAQQTLTQFQSAQNMLPQLKQQQQQANEAVNQAEKLVHATRITSPIDGMVSEVSVVENGITPPNTPVVTVIDQRQINSTFQVNSYVVSQLNKGNKGIVTFDGVEQEFQAQITSVSPTANPQTGLFTVQIPISNEKQFIKGGMKATATVTVRSLKDVLAIPSSAVLYEKNEPYVFTVENKKAVKTPVSLGFESDGVFQVLEGLENGDKIVVDGQERLKNGDAIQERKSE